MKESNYNFFFQLEDENFLAYNSLKNGMGIIDKINYYYLKNQEWEKIASEVKKELIKGGFLIEDDNFNELDLVFLRYRMNQFMGNRVGLTIAPTLNCNFGCAYCFESAGSETMIEQVQGKIIEFVKNYFKNGFKALDVTWYGGEPLLCFSEIKKLSEGLIGLCRRYKCSYSASIITNGSLLDEEKAKELQKLKVNFVQITLDGDEETHNRRRPYKDGRGSFKDIINNLKIACNYLPIALRINIDKTNAQIAFNYFSQLLKTDWFKKAQIHPHYGFVRKYTSSCRCKEEDCFSAAEYWQREVELIRYLNQNGYHYYPYPDIAAGCGATAINFYVIGPEGELYKCWNHIGNKTKVVGSIFEPIHLNSLYIKYLMESCATDQECLHCKVLPICQGGCIDLRIKLKEKEYQTKDCSRWKYYLEETLRDYYLWKIEQIKKLKKN